MTIQFLYAEKDDVGLRLDKFLHLKNSIPLSLIYKLIRKGYIRVNKTRKSNSYRLLEGDQIKTPTISQCVKKEKQVISPNITKHTKKFYRNIISEDSNLIFFNKPEDLCVQGGTKVHISVDQIIKSINVEYRIVHRIDKCTTGLLIIAKNRVTAVQISDLFYKQEIRKEYLAIVHGIPEKASGTISNKLDYLTNHSIRTHYKLLSRHGDDKSLLLLRPISGKKHQIRRHVLQMNTPILGDQKYRLPQISDKSQKLFLHAYRVSFKLFNKQYDIKANLPCHFSNILDRYFHDVEL